MQTYGWGGPMDGAIYQHVMDRSQQLTGKDRQWYLKTALARRPKVNPFERLASASTPLQPPSAGSGSSGVPGPARS